MRLHTTTKKKTNNAALLSLAAMVTVCLVMVCGATASAQVSTGQSQQHDSKRGPIQRVIDGKVTNKSDAFIAGAVVYLKDSKSLAVKTYITDDAGLFHFGQLSQNTDYELWAESNGVRSKSKSISSFDSKNSYNFTLKIDAAK
jgi:hypothetical protein